MGTFNLSIDGKTVDCPEGANILTAARMHGIHIPSLCDHPDLKPFGACRICLVEDQKSGRLMASCVTPAAPNMVIVTRSARIDRHRRNIVRLMMAEHPESCLVCSKGNRCKLRQLAAELGIGDPRLYPMPNTKRFEQANPFIVRDLSKCILCGKCIRADHELVAVGAIDYNLRGFKARPATVHELPLEASTCTFCGTCVSLCPTGALSPNVARGTVLYAGTPEREVLSVCGFCGIGCSLALGVAGERVVEINPAHAPESVNRSTLCIRGHFAHDFLNCEHRLSRPLIRKDGRHEPVEWDEALTLITRRLKELKDARGGESLAFLGSSKCSNEENYLFQKLARTLTGAHNVDNGGFVYGQTLQRRFEVQTGGGRVTPLADLETADAVLVLGADPCRSLPVAGYVLKRAAAKGIPLLVADPRKTELARRAAIWLGLRPQSDVELLNGLSVLLQEAGGHDPVFIERHTAGYDAYRAGLAALDLDRICRSTGLEPGVLRAAARLLKGKKIALVIGSGILQQKYGGQALDAARNLSLATGSIGAPKAGIYFMAGENNQAGAADMGSAPDVLPGRQPVTDAAARSHWEQAWGCTLSATAGLDLAGMIQAAETGRLSALFVMGENPLRALPRSQQIRAAFEKLDFLVVQDILLTETARLADVILPAAAVSEKDGSFTNLEGRIQSFAAAVPPPGEARPDWQILDLLAGRLKAFEPFGSLEKIRAEIRRLVPMYADLDAGRQGWLQPVGPAGVSKTGDTAERIDFSPVITPAAALPVDDYPFTAILGTPRCHLGSGTRTGCSPRIQALGHAGDIELSFEDADALGLTDGDRVTVSSPHGSLRRNIRRRPADRRHQLFIPLAADAHEALQLVALSDPTAADAPGWKTCRVRIEKATT